MVERSTEGLLWTVEHPTWEVLSKSVGADVYSLAATEIRDAVWHGVRNLEILWDERVPSPPGVSGR